MSFIAASIIGGIGAIGGGLLGASGARSAAAKAADANLRATQMTNDSNERLFNQSRGAPGADGFGHSILPNYFGGNEQAMGQAAYDQFQRLNSAGLQNYNQLQGFQNQWMPALNQSLSALGGRYNGGDLSQRLAYADPYWQSRQTLANNSGESALRTARAGIGAIDQGYNQTVAAMNAQRARQGYNGSSMFDRNRLMQATIGARQQGQVGLAQAQGYAQQLQDSARMGTAQDRFGLQMADMDFRANPSTLGAGLGAASSFLGMPAQALSQSFGTSMSPMNFFRVSPQAFQQQNAPMQEPQMNSSMMLGSAIGAAGNTAANYFLSQNLANRFGPQGGGANPYAYGGGSYGNQYIPNGNFMANSSPFSMPSQGPAAMPAFNGQFNSGLNYGAIQPPPRY